MPDWFQNIGIALNLVKIWDFLKNWSQKDKNNQPRRVRREREWKNIWGSGKDVQEIEYFPPTKTSKKSK
jgi:hypothetical protein